METYLVLILSALCDIKAVKDIHIEFALHAVIVIGRFQCPAGCLCPHKAAKVKYYFVSVWECANFFLFYRNKIIGRDVT